MRRTQRRRGQKGSCLLSESYWIGAKSVPGGSGSRRAGMIGRLVVFLLWTAGVLVRYCDAVLVFPGGAEQGVVRRSEIFRRLGSPETILGRAEVGPEKDTRKEKQGREREGQKTKEAVMKGREYNKEEDGTRVSSQCPVVSCRIVLYRRRWNGWKEVGEGRKRSQEQGARSQEPRALRGARSQDQNEQEHPPSLSESYRTKQANLHGKDEQVQGTGATAGTRAWAEWGRRRATLFVEPTKP